ncbi:MAG: PD40 domain-containing protein [Candidatus Eremiobacteraeota bacterium]|nr:PD40 domain-containing protein [Candidatus Eremiobacteraeota bacterium]
MRYLTSLLLVALSSMAHADNISFSRDGKRVVYCSSTKNQATVYDTAQKKPVLCTLKASFARLTADGKRVMIASPSSSLECHDSKTGKLLWKGGGAKRLEVSSDGRYVLVEDRVYNSLDGKEIGKYRLPNALGPDSKALVHGEYDSVQLLELPSGKVLKDIKVAGMVGSLSVNPGEVVCAYSPDGKRTTLTLLEYPGLKTKRSFDNPESQKSPDGTLEWKDELAVFYRGKLVYKGKPGERVSIWGRGGGFLLGHGRSPFAFMASNGVPIAGAEKNWRVVPGTPLGFVFLDKRLTFFNVLTGAKLGEVSGVEAVGDSDASGWLGYYGKSGLTLVKAGASVKAGKLISKPIS